MKFSLASSPSRWRGLHRQFCLNKIHQQNGPLEKYTHGQRTKPRVKPRHIGACFSCYEGLCAHKANVSQLACRNDICEKTRIKSTDNRLSSGITWPRYYVNVVTTHNYWKYSIKHTQYSRFFSRSSHVYTQPKSDSATTQILMTYYTYAQTSLDYESAPRSFSGCAF